MAATLKRIVPARVRRWVRPLTLAYQQRTQARNQRRLFGNFIAPGDLVFDIGANTGRLSAVFLDLGARVVAVEPQPHCIQAMAQAFQHNKRFSAVRVGVGARPGRQVFHVCGDIDEVSSFRPDWEARHYAARFTHQIETDITTLDHLIRARGLPDFCKIDVEGYELEVFRGLSRPIPHLCFEFHRHQWPETEACFTELKRLGAYRFNFAPHEVQRLQLQEWVTAGELMEWLGYRGIISGDIFARLQ